MKKDKLYFKDFDSEMCYSLEWHVENSLEGKLVLFEAIKDHSVNDYIYCKIFNIVENSECKKSQCIKYSSKSGRGKCIHKGNFYIKGKEVNIDLLKLC